MTWLPCPQKPKGKDGLKARKLFELDNEGWIPRRSLATKGKDYCSEKASVFTSN